MNNKTRKLTETALLIAMATVLSLIQFPGPWVNGGSITLCSMLPICIIGYRYGVRWGILGGFVHGLLQLLLGVNGLKGISLETLVLSVILDYLLAFAVLGFSGLFRNKIKNASLAFAAGSTVGIVLRFVCHFISGAFVWDTILADTGLNWAGILYSLSYNGSYMGPELIITLAAGVFSAGCSISPSPTPFADNIICTAGDCLRYFFARKNQKPLDEPQ